MPTLNNPAVFIETITRERQKRDMSQSKLSQLSNMPLNYINKVEKGIRTPNLVTLCKIYNALGLKLTIE